MLSTGEMLCVALFIIFVISAIAIIKNVKSISKTTDDTVDDFDLKEDSTQIVEGDCYRDIKILYNSTGRNGAIISSVSYIKKNGANFNGMLIHAGESFVIEDCVKKGTITMSGKFQVISSINC